MKSDFKRFFSSQKAKRFYLLLTLVLFLFFIFNDLLLPWYVKQGGTIEIPSVIGKKFENAKLYLDSLGLEAQKGDTRIERKYPPGVVIIQNPTHGSIVKKGRRIYLTISEEEKLLHVPNIKGRTIREGRFTLEREGFRLGVVENRPSDEYPPNTICEQSVNPGAISKRDSYISVVISQGSYEQKKSVPDLRGKSLTEAAKILAKSGFKVGVIKFLPSVELLPNTVIDQFPSIGELVQYGQTIDLFVVRSTDKVTKYLEN